MPADQWNLEYRDVLTLTVVAENLLNSRTFNLTGLDPSSRYEFRVQGVANSSTLTGEWSEWSEFLTAATPTLVTPTFSTDHALDVF